jgi:hypothetical protein
MTNLGLCIDSGGKRGIKDGRVYYCIEDGGLFKINNDEGSVAKLYKRRFLLLHKILSESEYTKIEQWFSL